MAKHAANNNRRIKHNKMAKHAANNHRRIKHNKSKKKDISYGNPLAILFQHSTSNNSKHAATHGVRTLSIGHKRLLPFVLTAGITISMAFIANASADIYNGTNVSLKPATAFDFNGMESSLSSSVSRSESRSLIEHGTWGGIESLDVPITKSALEVRRENVFARNASKQSIVENAVKSQPSNVTWLGVDAVPLTLDNQEAMDDYNTVGLPAGFNANHDTGDVGNAYEFSQCTWWAYTRRHELGLPAGSHMGDGRMWYDTAQKLGYLTSIGNPVPGDVISFTAGSFGSSPVYGHVAIVEYVSPNGDVLTSESGSNYNGKYFNRVFPASIAKSLRYIHL